MGTDVQLETIDGTRVEDLPSCRYNGFELYQDLDIDTYQGMVYPFEEIYKKVKAKVESLSRDEILTLYLQEEYIWPKSVLYLYKTIDAYKLESEKYQIRFH
jgi:hypothetical protein